MDYHGERFRDHSILFRQNGRLIAVLPASEARTELVSHGGLTFGGLILSLNLGAHVVAECVTCLLDYVRSAGFKSLVYKQIPSFYRHDRSDKEEFALAQAGAKLYRVELGFVVEEGPKGLNLQERRRRGVRKAQKAGVRISRAPIEAFYLRVLAPCMAAKFGLKPVHTLEELTLLIARFPERIKVWGAFQGGNLIAGTVVFESERAVHSQYIASTEKAREISAIDLLFTHLIGQEYKEKPFFSLGTANYKENGALIEGLVNWKEGLGAVAYAHRWYRFTLDG